MWICLVCQPWKRPQRGPSLRRPFSSSLWDFFCIHPGLGGECSKGAAWEHPWLAFCLLSSSALRVTTVLVVPATHCCGYITCSCRAFLCSQALARISATCQSFFPVSSWQCPTSPCTEAPGQSTNMLPEEKLESCTDYAWIWVVISVFQMLQEITETQDLIVASCFNNLLKPNFLHSQTAWTCTCLALTQGNYFFIRLTKKPVFSVMKGRIHLVEMLVESLLHNRTTGLPHSKSLPSTSTTQTLRARLFCFIKPHP